MRGLQRVATSVTESKDKVDYNGRFLCNNPTTTVGIPPSSQNDRNATYSLISQLVEDVILWLNNRELGLTYLICAVV